MRARVLTLIAVASILGCRSPVHGPLVVDAPPELQEVRARVLAMVEAGEIPSMSVGIAREGEIVWMEGLGMADKESSVPASPETIYAIGSTSKSMTATLAMALSEQGLFDIDRSVDGYLDRSELQYLSIEGEFPTTRDLLSMTGGVPHGGGVTGRPEFTLPRGELARRAEIVAYPPGTIYEYSNYSIGLAMRAMEGATGLDCGELMYEFVFKPLGMRESSVSYPEGDKHQATLYGADGERINGYRFYPEAAGGFYSSVSDLMRFGLFHAGQRVPEQSFISAENLRLMHTALPPNVPGALAALGFGSVELPTAGVTLLTSNGNVRGGNSHVSILEPTGDVVVTAVNMNSRDSIADSIALDIAEVLRPGIKEDFGRRVDAYRLVRRQPFAGDPSWTGSWQGVLEAPDYAEQIQLTFADDGAVTGQLGNSQGLNIDDLRFPHGSVTGRVEGLIGPGSQPIRMSLQEEVLYGHIVVRRIDGDTHGSYPYRMRLTRRR